MIRREETEARALAESPTESMDKEPLTEIDMAWLEVTEQRQSLPRWQRKWHPCGTGLHGAQRNIQQLILTIARYRSHLRSIRFAV